MRIRYEFSTLSAIVGAVAMFVAASMLMNSVGPCTPKQPEVEVPARYKTGLTIEQLIDAMAAKYGTPTAEESLDLDVH
jgi:hypothetical protein